MKSKDRISLLILLVFVGSAYSISYTGYLSSHNNEIDGREACINPGPTTIEWNVTENPDSSWHYEYTLTVPAIESEVSHCIIEVSKSFDNSDIFNESGSFSTIEIMMHVGMSPGSPSMPEDMYGIKFDNTTGTTVMIAFDSWRTPVWGDFYAKCGGCPSNEAWNMGFGNPDSDPILMPINGSIVNHILVPDTYSPEPSSILILLIGAIMLRRLKRIL